MNNKDNNSMTFSCRYCGHSYDVYPPDSSFEAAYISPCIEQSSEPNHNLKTFYECDNCDTKNELYWCNGHVFVASFNPRRSYEDPYTRRLRDRLGY